MNNSNQATNTTQEIANWRIVWERLQRLEDHVFGKASSPDAFQTKQDEPECKYRYNPPFINDHSQCGYHPPREGENAFVKATRKVLADMVEPFAKALAERDLELNGKPSEAVEEKINSILTLLDIPSGKDSFGRRELEDLVKLARELKLTDDKCTYMLCEKRRDREGK